jgi:uncharacterized protein YciI
MPYVIDATDGSGKADLRQKVRPDHLAYVEANVHRLLAAGAKLSDDGATALGTLYLIDTDERGEAEAFVAADPYSKAGVFGTVTVTRWRKGFFDFKRQPPGR